MIDVEGMLIAFLKDRTDAPVRTKVPNPRPAKFTRLWRSGGAATNRILDFPQVTITSWGTSSVDAWGRLEPIRAAILNESAAMPLVRGVEEIGGPYYDPDPATGADRYTFTVALRVRASR